MEANTAKATVSVEEAARILGISRGTAYTAVHNGDIPSFRIRKRILIPKGPFNVLVGRQEQDTPG